MVLDSGVVILGKETGIKKKIVGSSACSTLVIFYFLIWMLVSNKKFTEKKGGRKLERGRLKRNHFSTEE